MTVDLEAIKTQLADQKSWVAAQEMFNLGAKNHQSTLSHGEVAALVDEVERLRAVVGEHRSAMLLNGRPRQCACCFHDWPCRTARLLEAGAS